MNTAPTQGTGAAPAIIGAGAVLLILAAATGVWEAKSPHTIEITQTRPSEPIEGVRVLEVTRHGASAGRIVIDAQSAFVSGALLDAVLEGGAQEYRRMRSAGAPQRAETLDARAQRMTAYIEALHQRRERNLRAQSRWMGMIITVVGASPAVLMGLAGAGIIVAGAGAWNGARAKDRAGRRRRAAMLEAHQPNADATAGGEAR